jgi:hypothetical protein
LQFTHHFNQVWTNGRLWENVNTDEALLTMANAIPGLRTSADQANIDSGESDAESDEECDDENNHGNDGEEITTRMRRIA